MAMERIPPGVVKIKDWVLFKLELDFFFLDKTYQVW
jgi:hypothetical protein